MYRFNKFKLKYQPMLKILDKLIKKSVLKNKQIRKIIFKITWYLGFSLKYYWMGHTNKSIEYVRLAIDLK